MTEEEYVGVRKLLEGALGGCLEGVRSSWRPAPEPSYYSYVAEDGGKGLARSADGLAYYYVRAAALSRGHVNFVEDSYLVFPPQSESRRSSRYMKSMELRAAAEALEVMPSAQLALFDGSAVSMLGWEWPGGAKRASLEDVDQEMDLAAKLVGFRDAAELWEELKGYRAVAAPRLLLARGVLNAEVAEALEQLELMAHASRVLAQLAGEGHLAVFTAKSSRRGSLCDGVNDLALVGLAVREPGFMLVRQGTLAEALGEGSLPSLGGLRQLARSLNFVDVVARLSPRGAVLRLQSLSSTLSGEPLAREAVAALEGLRSMEGYPLPLVMAHANARVPRDFAALRFGLMGFNEARLLMGVA
ncbi:hypothetical protein ASAC_1503 [Acidilobus saccharovorans 345-15]|uniref:NurA domain-containing protein n=1 Tax=Acidilobus saccharovorans (strain DSM 16705 / JCM 18335 / VKM B-2471 / 345-15) TaxID=666510 RepID=D9PZC1_ACIS3|nr:DNA double-strand break repair nuclease NurA [Acidilobus saccharovorans]ADL19908.1 hypothetical protein ASAC_1503 [Acidilobus saccharovorans 345-15]